jgi:hypothetical protein
LPELHTSGKRKKEAHVAPHEVLFEELREEEILNLPRETVEQLILLGEHLVFRIGSAVLLGSFRINTNRLVIEFAQIEGGGEGVLMALASLAKRYSNLRNLSEIEWIVRAVSCAKPNLKPMDDASVAGTVPSLNESPLSELRFVTV